MKLAWPRRTQTPPLSEAIHSLGETVNVHRQAIHSLSETLTAHRQSLDAHYERDRMLLLSLEHLLVEMDGPFADRLDRILDRWTQELTEQD